MNYLILICGLAFLSGEPAHDKAEKCKNSDDTKVVFHDNCEKNADLDLDEIVYIEEDSEIDLGFDTADYLPENFDPHKLYVDLNAIEYIEDDGEIELGFNSKAYLPQGFDPYADPFGIEGINYIEEEVEFDLGFDTAEYLPSNFDPYARIEGSENMVAL